MTYRILARFPCVGHTGKLVIKSFIVQAARIDDERESDRAACLSTCENFIVVLQFLASFRSGENVLLDERSPLFRSGRTALRYEFHLDYCIAVLLS